MSKKAASKKEASKKAAPKKAAPKKEVSKKTTSKKEVAKKPVAVKKTASVKPVTPKEKDAKNKKTVAVKPTSKPAEPALMTKKGKEKAKDIPKIEPKNAPKGVPQNAPKDQGDLLIEKAKEEMAAINSQAKAIEKAAKVKPIKIERGNAADEKAKWQELNKRHGKEKAYAYKMTESYEAMKPIQHKVLGWGFILTNENNRLEVLFENGIKMLISNYKPS